MNAARSKFLAAAVLLLFTAACNLPSVATPTPFQFPTPDLTLTAIFSPLAPSPTSPPQVATATQVEPVQSSPTSPQATPTWTLPAGTVVATSPATAAPTAAQQPTATSGAPTATSAPLVRGGTGIRAAFLSSRPRIDGDLSDWSLTRYDVRNVVFGRQNWENEIDLSGFIMVGWDNTYLFIAGQQFDDQPVQNATGENLFMGDSFEILLDTNLQDDYYTSTLSPDDFQLGVSPGTGMPYEDPEAYLWFPTNLAGAKDFDIGIRMDKDDYIFEVAIPWTVFEMTPVGGRHYGFAFSFSDNDTFNTQRQETMVSTAAGRDLSDPMTWGDLLLVR